MTCQPADGRCCGSPGLLVENSKEHSLSSAIIFLLRLISSSKTLKEECLLSVMAAMASAQLLQFSLPPPQFPRNTSQSSRNYLQPHPSSFTGAASSRRSLRCSSSSNGRSPESQSKDQAVNDVERLLKEKRRDELAARISSGKFTVDDSGFATNP